MNKIAVWIFNSDFLIPTYLSVSSFIECGNIPILLLACDPLDSDIETTFTDLGKNISLRYFHPDGLYPFADNSPPSVLNRLARMDIVSSMDDETILFLFDSDTLFSNDVDFFLKQIKVGWPQKNTSVIWGVKERERALDASFLYFARRDSSGRKAELPALQEMHACYEGVYGPNWETILSSVQLNNGVLAFYRCQSVSQLWKSYFIDGFKYDCINHAEDQVPLSAAINVSQCEVKQIDRDFNSLGNLYGDFVVYHAWNGLWKWECVSIIEGEESSSDFGMIARKYWHKIPEQWIGEFYQKIRIAQLQSR